MKIINFKDNFFNIKISQFLFYFIFIYFIDIKYFLDQSYLPEILFLPTGIFSVFDSPLILPGFCIIVLKYTWLMTAILCGLNVYYKACSIIFFIITYIAFNISHNYGYQTHTYMPLVLAAGAMAFGKSNRIFLVRFIFCSVFFMAGMSKIRNSGLDWILTESMQNILLRSEIYYYDTHYFAHQFRLNIAIAKNLILTQIIGFLAVFLEIISPLALFRWRASGFILLSLLIMQVCIYFTIFVNFKVYALLYIFWIDWQKLYDRCVRMYAYNK